ncbi:uncharacterized protein ARB_05931 [Trichophyton benhamiae CBS 112371]|uniref:Uncharacterized protein n=1 Tax=Arthroderma benhamiae (strain ATCC MYA-4681 / CBS 112371) TaxID=663331 RepID=D4ANW4_ARTBC|nr:uncharacterized protein ARB_05931 [Trichophyton benhamiae CBS 112371]EFE34975.1 hypothetical protein ARB_05931 [Trichophyton benhamiae CBS 112371]
MLRDFRYLVEEGKYQILCFVLRINVVKVPAGQVRRYKGMEVLVWNSSSLHLVQRRQKLSRLAGLNMLIVTGCHEISMLATSLLNVENSSARKELGSSGKWLETDEITTSKPLDG